MTTVTSAEQSWPWDLFVSPTHRATGCALPATGLTAFLDAFLLGKACRAFVRGAGMEAAVVNLRIDCPSVVVSCGMPVPRRPKPIVHFELSEPRPNVPRASRPHAGRGPCVPYRARLVCWADARVDDLPAASLHRPSRHSVLPRIDRNAPAGGTENRSRTALRALPCPPEIISRDVALVIARAGTGGPSNRREARVAMRAHSAFKLRQPAGEGHMDKVPDAIKLSANSENP